MREDLRPDENFPEEDEEEKVRGQRRLFQRGRRCACGRLLARCNRGPDCFNCQTLAELRASDIRAMKGKNGRSEAGQSF